MHKKLRSSQRGEERVRSETPRKGFMREAVVSSATRQGREWYKGGLGAHARCMWTFLTKIEFFLENSGKQGASEPDHAEL